MKVRVSGIEWDTDGEDVDLPSDVTIEVDEDMSDEDVVNKVSDKYGWCISSVCSVKRKAVRSPAVKYGIIAYGKAISFGSKKKFEDYLVDWMSHTSGSERDRAVDAFVNLKQGFNFTDTDRGTRCR